MATNRDALLQAAIQCLQERGYANISARDLVEVSGTNLGAIGYHFGSKEALINEAITHNIREWIDALGALLRRHVGQGGGLRAALEELITTVGQHESLVTAFFDALAQAGHSSELRRQLAAHYEQFRNDVAEAFRPVLDQVATSSDSQTLSTLLVAVADGLIIQRMLGPTHLPTSTQLLASLRTLSQLADIEDA
ncbi:TetR family transcriptional regulator [Halopolyspora algeriensis]|uniref:TetR family transcriptional regulator n=1 Tax=Halopolyspora algeriensis TaxID=1500506 RepID=A0A368W024_9ACTN|nr:TetR/AcrR family transcriptional regulator [Halopolyspora algeriensis]RCW46972.1 TetR family transcriptional regulator [Halopolyspora algeriensis]TQM48062.1 TetR family transcriptional regulator [Halopolyspora algeriensis]